MKKKAGLWSLMQKRGRDIVRFYSFYYLTINIGGAINMDINFFSSLKHFN